ncbi:aspartyl/asparaginyl beta-hydroxylase domain-containing protein [Altererythrobacter luteolus]|uniref:Aspartyl/asparaginyl beta-hydroxylase domain-containing protein n=1 Tax=Pontixanthobacter luteolus TaxID=295089 RepID=A0A6I4V451_9SPHN|nr:aspartyl/asparaginyl beta-hydroxylase domain-containing protein [Pontixanthobacter luteolus]MXP48151.1 aspartyl/asparaginyl beta-hydroxylase domain-containing protein [Pontixanthobacter luteolus]
MYQPPRQRGVAPDPQHAEHYVRPRQKPLVRIGKRLRDPVNRFLAGQSLIGDTPVIDARLIPGLNEVAREWSAMRDEIIPLMREREIIPPLGKISPDHRRIASSPAWKSFFFQGYGYHAADNQARCPLIADAISRIPGVVVAFLSIMEPGTHVPRHRGLTKSWLNCHLPLMLPKDGKRCEIAVDGTTHQWREGEWFVFDETYPHEVWNMSDEPRVMLLLQVQRDMKLPGRIATRMLYHAIRRSSFVGDVKNAVGA